MTGKQAFRSVNLARMLQGLQQIKTPETKALKFMADDFEITVTDTPPLPPPPLWVHVWITWRRGGTPQGTNWCGMVWGHAGRSGGHAGMWRGDYQWLGALPWTHNNPVCVDGLLAKARIVLPGGAVSLQVGVCEVGFPPIVVRRYSFQNKMG